MTNVKVAFLGLGVMGYPMAGHLKAKGGHDVTVYNRTAAKAAKWAEQFGGNYAATPADAVKNADFVFACIGNDDDLRSVTIGADGAFSTMKKDAIFIDNTTASAEVAREIDKEAQKRRLSFHGCACIGRTGRCRKRRIDGNGWRIRASLRACKAGH